MNLRLLHSLAAFLAFTLTAWAGPLKIAIVGDSTVCDYPEAHPCRGWGQFIAGYFDESVTVVNRAASGRSTRTFIAEKRWEKALAEKPQLVLIQFGHNDSHAKDRPEATGAATDFRDNLRRYLDDARAVGAEPVLVTPMHRRSWKPDGTLDDILQPYADAMKAVAMEKNAPLIDLHAMSRDLYLKLGREKAAELANAPGDHTHFGEKGARAMAELVMSRLTDAVPALQAKMRRP